MVPLKRKSLIEQSQFVICLFILFIYLFIYLFEPATLGKENVCFLHSLCSQSTIFHFEIKYWMLQKIIMILDQSISTLFDKAGQ